VSELAPESLDTLGDLEAALALTSRLLAHPNVAKAPVLAIREVLLAKTNAVLAEVAAGLPVPEAAKAPDPMAQPESPTAAWRRARGGPGGDGRDGQAFPPQRRW
jgi:hypothetical protein